MTKARSANWIQLLPEQVREDVLAHMVRRSFKDGQYIYHFGEPSTTQYQIAKGSVRLRVLAESGKEITYIIYGPGDCIGFLSAVDQEPRPQDAIAIGDVEVDCLAVSDFEQLRACHPEIDRALTLHVARRLRETFKAYEVGSFFSLRRRLAHQICFLLEFAGHSSGGQTHDELDMTQELLASSVCATRQAISKVLKDWADEGIVEYRYGRIRVLDRERLEAISEGIDT